MKSRTGYIQYMQFTLGSNKGGVEQGTVFNDPFKLGQMNDSRVAYTSAFVPEEVTVDKYGEAKTGWFPVRDVKVVDAESGVEVEILDAAKGILKFTGVEADTKVKIGYIYDNVVIPQNDIPTVKAHMEGIALSAKARRVQVYYSQMAA